MQCVFVRIEMWCALHNVIHVCQMEFNIQSQLVLDVWKTSCKDCHYESQTAIRFECC